MQVLRDSASRRWHLVVHDQTRVPEHGTVLDFISEIPLHEELRWDETLRHTKRLHT